MKKQQSWFAEHPIWVGIITAILVLIGFSMYSNYKAEQKYDYFYSRLTYIEDRAWEMPELVKAGVYPAERGLDELDELEKEFKEIEETIYYGEYNFGRTHLMILGQRVRTTEMSLLTNKQQIAMDYVSGLVS